MAASPARQYVGAFLLAFVYGPQKHIVAQKSEPMPEILGHAPPDFGRFRNVLKIMAGLNPVLYPEPRQGTIRLALKREMDGQSWECTYAVAALFSDRGDDPSIDLRVELESRKPWEDHVDPALDYLT